MVFVNKFLQVSLLSSYNRIVALIFSFDLISTKIHQLIIFFLLSQFHRAFKTFLKEIVQCVVQRLFISAGNTLYF